LSIGFNPVFAQSDVIAIDVLLNPDKTMLDSAAVYNGQFQKNYNGAGSFLLDETHTPHITVLQCFVKKSDLKKVYEAVTKVVKSDPISKEILTAKGLYYIPVNGLGLAGITIDTTPNLLSFQTKLIEAIKPFMVKGSDAAFVQNANSKPIAAGTADYVNAFIPDHSGVNYNPHVTVGLAHEDFLKELISKSFHKFTFSTVSVSIYQLGDFGTAQRKLWEMQKE
jgi:hypothetical protein